MTREKGEPITVWLNAVAVNMDRTCLILDDERGRIVVDISDAHALSAAIATLAAEAGVPAPGGDLSPLTALAMRDAAADVADEYIKMRDAQIGTEKAKPGLQVDVPQIMRWQAGKVQSEVIAERIRILPLPPPEALLAAALALPEVKALVEALNIMRHAVLGETGFANAVRQESGFAYPWPALDEAERISDVALASLTGDAR